MLAPACIPKSGRLWVTARGALAALPLANIGADVAHPSLWVMVLSIRFPPGSEVKHEPVRCLRPVREALSRSALQVAAIEATESFGQRQTD